jgi:hypothetical protein
MNVCGICSKSYKRPEHLRRHLLSHSSWRPYVCTTCKSSFQRSDVLRRHQQTCDGSILDSSEDLEPPSKRQILSRPTVLSNAEAHAAVADPDPAISSIFDELILPDQQTGFHLEQIASWASSANTTHDDDVPIDLWQDFLNSSPDSGNYREVSNPSRRPACSLGFLDNFTTKSGLAQSFDCGSVEQRQKALSFYSSKSAVQGAASVSLATFSAGSPSIPGKVETSLGVQDAASAAMSVPQWLSDPMSLKSHEILASIKDIVIHRSGQRTVTLTWSSTVQDSCAQFFSPSNIRRYLGLYWALWHPNVNIMHKPTFDPLSSKAYLLATMCLIGACMSPDTEDSTRARLWFNCVEELVFNSDDFCDDAQPPTCRDTGEVKWRHEKLRALQAAYMVLLYQTWEGTDSSKRRVRRLRFSMVIAAIRDVGIRNARHPNYSNFSLGDFSFIQFAAMEELIRVILWVFLVDTAFVIFNNLPPRMVIKEMKLSPACPEICFQATTSEECLKALQSESKNNFIRPHQATQFGSAFELLYQSPIDDTTIMMLADFGPLNLFAMTSTLHALVFHYQSTFGCHGSLDSIKTVLDSWSSVWQAYVENFSADQRHSPVPPGFQDLEPEEMWKRVGFMRHAEEYWLLAKLMVDNLSHSEETLVGTNQSTSEHGRMSIGAPEGRSVDPLLNEYDETSMEQVNALIADFQKVGL